MTTANTAGLLLGALLVAAGCQSTATRHSTSASTAPAATSPVPAVTAPATTAATVPSVTAPAPASPCGGGTTPAAIYQHVVWIWMENHTWPQVLGDAKNAPYEVGLASRCGTATNYRSVGSPSLPNYIGATSGATHGISDDADPARHPLTADNLFGQVRAAGGTERSYEEDMATPCQLTSGGEYAVKHNPAAYYVGPGGADRAACQTDDVGFGHLAADVASGRLPTFTFVTPNLCHDSHDCSVAAGDAWLAGFLPPLLTSSTYRSGATVIFVIWDEESPMANIVIGPSVHPGTVVGAPLDHYALLHTTEELLGIPGRLGAAVTSPSLRGLFNL